MAPVLGGDSYFYAAKRPLSPVAHTPGPRTTYSRSCPTRRAAGIKLPSCLNTAKTQLSGLTLYLCMPATTKRKLSLSALALALALSPSGLNSEPCCPTVSPSTELDSDILLSLHMPHIQVVASSVPAGTNWICFRPSAIDLATCGSCLPSDCLSSSCSLENALTCLGLGWASGTQLAAEPKQAERDRVPVVSVAASRVSRYHISARCLTTALHVFCPPAKGEAQLSMDTHKSCASLGFTNRKQSPSQQPMTNTSVLIAAPVLERATVRTAARKLISC